jgi:uncharacterized membrane protein (DUF4010 family)
VTRRFRASLFSAVLVLSSAGASAGPFGDDMAKCLVRATTAADKSMLVQWMFAVMSLHPDVGQLSSIAPDQRLALNQSMGNLMISLLTDRCAAESREALKNEGISTIESSFNVLGQVAAQSLFSNPDVAAGIAEFGKLVDGEKLKALLTDSK